MVQSEKKNVSMTTFTGKICISIKKNSVVLFLVVDNINTEKSINRTSIKKKKVKISVKLFYMQLNFESEDFFLFVCFSAKILLRCKYV